MKTIMAFYLNGCPYCANAKKAVEELTRENAAYQSIDLTWYEETEHADLLPAHPYTYVPNMFVDDEKRYEAHPGEMYDETKAKIKAVFDSVL